MKSSVKKKAPGRKPFSFKIGDVVRVRGFEYEAVKRVTAKVPPGFVSSWGQYSPGHR